MIYRNTLGIKGTFLISAIGSNGIMMASDTRSNIYDMSNPQNSSLAFFDGTQKTHVLGNNLISFTGTSIFDGYYTCHFIEEYLKQNPTIPTISNLIESYLSFCKNNMSTNAFERLRANRIIAAGYERGIPIINYYTWYKDFGVINSERNYGFAQSDESHFNHLYSINLTCEKLGALAQYAIYQYSTDNNKRHCIGGEISIAKIENNEICWLVNPPNQKWRCTEELLKLIESEEIELMYTKKEDKENLKKFLNI